MKVNPISSSFGYITLYFVTNIFFNRMEILNTEAITGTKNSRCIVIFDKIFHDDCNVACSIGGNGVVLFLFALRYHIIECFKYLFVDVHNFNFKELYKKKAPALPRPLISFGQVLVYFSRKFRTSFETHNVLCRDLDFFTCLWVTSSSSCSFRD